MKKWIRIGVGIAALLLVGLAATGFFLYRASQQMPEFYEEALQADPGKQAVASAQMVRQATTLASDTQRSGRWQATFTEEQINGWLAVDLVRNYRHMLPGAVSDPRVHIKPESLTVAFRYHDPHRQAVVSLTADVYLVKPNVVALRVRSARAGALPLPLDSILKEVSKTTDQLEWKVQWRQSEGDPVAQITIPPMRNRANQLIQIETLRLEDGKVFVAGSTKSSR